MGQLLQQQVIQIVENTSSLIAFQSSPYPIQTQASLRKKSSIIGQIVAVRQLKRALTLTAALSADVQALNMTGGWEELR